MAQQEPSKNQETLPTLNLENWLTIEFDRLGLILVSRCNIDENKPALVTTTEMKLVNRLRNPSNDNVLHNETALINLIKAILSFVDKILWLCVLIVRFLITRYQMRSFIWLKCVFFHFSSESIRVFPHGSLCWVARVSKFAEKSSFPATDLHFSTSSRKTWDPLT